MSAKDPYAEFGGKAQSTSPTSPQDPYAEFGGATVAATSPAKRGGATGSWEPPHAATVSPVELVSRTFLDPLVHFGQDALAHFGQGVVDAAKGAYNTVAAPLTKQEQDEQKLGGGLLGTVARRIIRDPGVAEDEKADTAATAPEKFGHSLAAKIPLVGPFAAHLGERIGAGEVPQALGELAFGYLTGKAGGELGELTDSLRMPEWKRAINERQISAMGDLINSGVKNKSSYTAAEIAIPLWQQAAAELGTTLDQSLEGAFPKHGFTEAGKRAVRTAGEEVVGGPTSPVGIANHAVEIAQRPFNDVLGAHGQASTNRPVFGGVRVPQVKQGILSTLESAAKVEDGVNDALAKAIRSLSERVQSNGDTFNALNELKVLANKKSSAIFDKNVSGQINATAETAYAWKVLGDSIRSEMYPELSRLSGTDLRQAGMREAVAMDARDGVMKKYYNEVEPAQQARMKLTYLEYLRQGSLFKTNLINRALGMTPAGEFNLTTRRAIGQVPPTPTMPGAQGPSVPIYPARNPGLPETIAGTQHDLLPNDVNAPLLAPPPGTSSAIGQSIFGVQQRANAAARSAPPETITGQQTSIAEHALPDSPFYPGKGGLHVETITGPDGKPTQVLRDYSQQHQLFSVNQTPYHWSPTVRATSTLQDLSALSHEIDTYLKTQNPPPNIRRQWESDLEDVNHEIHRRKEAQKA